MSVLDGPKVAADGAPEASVKHLDTPLKLSSVVVGVGGVDQSDVNVIMGVFPFNWSVQTYI